MILPAEKKIKGQIEETFGNKNRFNLAFPIYIPWCCRGIVILILLDLAGGKAIPPASNSFQTEESFLIESVKEESSFPVCVGGDRMF